jgi:hypothetical protein
MLSGTAPKYLSTPLQLCKLNTAVFTAVSIYLTVRKAYAHSQVALKGSHQILLVHMTSETIQWIQSKLEDGGAD